MTTENNDVGALLDGLAPKTEFAEFAALWDGIKAARDRKVSRKAIYEELVKNRSLSVSYVTFTRFVKKMEEDFKPPLKSENRPVGSFAPNPAKSVAQADHEEKVIVNSEDKSAKVVTAAASALDEARNLQKGKDYSRIGKK